MISTWPEIVQALYELQNLKDFIYESISSLPHGIINSKLRVLGTSMGL